MLTLKASVETCIARDAARAKSYGEDATRVVHMFVSVFDYGMVIDTEEENVQQTIRSVMEMIEQVTFKG